MREGVRYTIEIYITSDETGLQACFRIGSSEPLPEIKVDIDPVELLASFGKELPDAALDWRFMTRVEINDYRRDNG